MTWARKTGAGLTLSASCTQPQARRGLLPSSASSRGGPSAERGGVFVIASSARLPRLIQCGIAVVDPCDGGRTASAPRRGPRRRAVAREPRGEMRRAVSRDQAGGPSTARRHCRYSEKRRPARCGAPPPAEHAVVHVQVISRGEGHIRLSSRRYENDATERGMFAKKWPTA